MSVQNENTYMYKSTGQPTGPYVVNAPPPQALGTQPAPVEQSVLYVLAPQGSFPVTGAPHMFAVPQGQAMSYPPLQGASPAYTTNIPQFVSIPKPQSSRPRYYAVLSLIFYLLGIFIMPLQIPSIALSLHMCVKGYIRQKKAAVIALCVMELIGWAFVPAFAWFGDEDCYYTQYPYDTCMYMWWGWISFVVYGAFEIMFGIPRILYTWRYDSEVEETFAIMPVGTSSTFAAHADYVPYQQF